MNYPFSSACSRSGATVLQKRQTTTIHLCGRSVGNPSSMEQFDDRILNLQYATPPKLFYAMMNLFCSHETNRALFLRMKTQTKMTLHCIRSKLRLGPRNRKTQRRGSGADDHARRANHLLRRRSWPVGSGCQGRQQRQADDPLQPPALSLAG